MKRCFVVFAVMVVLLTTPAAHAGKKTFIKFSTLAPEGSSWMKQLRVLDKKLKDKTGGEVAFKFYAGGVSGDEKDVIRKMRVGQLHAAGFTGVGLGEILPQVRVFDLPFLFDDDLQVEHVYEKMNDYFAARFEEKGYILLGWVPVGWVHFFSNEPITNLDDLKKSKAWMWEGDPLVQEAYEVMGVTPHPLSVTDVLLSLQTGMIDTVYASSMGALALQWVTKVDYMSQVRMGHATGAVLMTKKKFDRLPDKYQTAIKEISRECLGALVQQIKDDNVEAVVVMRKNGLKLAPMPSKEKIAEFHKSGAVTRKNLTGKLIPQELLNKVLFHLNEVR